MPTVRRIHPITSLASTIIDGAPTAQSLHRRMYEKLSAQYGNHIRIVQIDMVPRKPYNVHTTWALDRHSIEALEASFSQRWQDVSGRIRSRWSDLSSNDTIRCPLPARVPLD